MTRYTLLFSLLALGCFALAGGNAAIPLPEATVILSLAGIVLACVAAGTFKV